MDKVEHSWLDGLFVFGPVVLLLLVAIWRDWGSYFDSAPVEHGFNDLDEGLWIPNADGSFTNELTGERLN